MLKTKRLILRPYRNSDAKELAKKINNINIAKWLPELPYPYKLKDAKTFFKIIKQKKKDIYFAITLHDKVIGGIGIHHIDKYSGTATTGYWLAQKYWRQGYGSEALKAVLDYAFKKLKLIRVEAGVFPGNPSSGKLLKKFGAKLEGKKRKALRCKATGKIQDELMYGILKEDYRRKML